MPQRNIVILDKEEAPWRSFLEEFFNDTPSLIHSFDDPVKANQHLAKHSADILFIRDSLLAPVLVQKIKASRQLEPETRIFELGTDQPPSKNLPYDFVFKEPIIFSEFQKKLVNQLPFPEKIRLLVVDDGPEIGEMFKDFLTERTHPSFETEYQNNGQKGLAAVETYKPDVIVLDVKMPVMSGIEVYRAMHQKGWPIPVIIFFDAIFGDEVMQIHKIGRPAIVEKGSHESQMPEMLPLILKMYYFA